MRRKMQKRHQNWRLKERQMQCPLQWNRCSRGFLSEKKVRLKNSYNDWHLHSHFFFPVLFAKFVFKRKKNSCALKMNDQCEEVIKINIEFNDENSPSIADWGSDPSKMIKSRMNAWTWWRISCGTTSASTTTTIDYSTAPMQTKDCQTRNAYKTKRNEKKINNCIRQFIVSM